MDISKTVLLFAIAVGIVAAIQIGMSTDAPLSWFGWVAAATLVIVTAAVGSRGQRPVGTRTSRILATLVLAAVGVALLVVREARTEAVLIGLPVAVVIVFFVLWSSPRRAS
jgi:uncharacterized membrane protein YfcA